MKLKPHLSLAIKRYRFYDAASDPVLYRELRKLRIVNGGLFGEYLKDCRGVGEEYDYADSIIFIAKLNNSETNTSEYVGWSFVSKIDLQLWFFVRPDLRRLGIGSCLATRAKAYAKRNNIIVKNNTDMAAHYVQNFWAANKIPYGPS